MKQKNSFSGQIGFVFAAAGSESAWETSGVFHIWQQKTGEDFS